MKMLKQLFLMTGMAGGILATLAVSAADDVTTNTVTADTNTVAAQSAPPPGNATPQPAPAPDSAAPPPAVTNAPPPASDSTTNYAVDFAAGQGLRMKFRGVPLETVLDYMSKAAGFTIHPTHNVDIRGKVDIWSDQPLSKPEAVALLKQILSENGYSVIQDGRLLTIVPTAEIKKDAIPTETFTTVAAIPRDSEVVTMILPVRTLNPVQLLENLRPLLASDSTQINANESANALVITDTHSNIRRLAEIVSALDSVSSGVNTIRVFPLKYADAKTVAGLIKDLFPTADTGGGAGARGGGGARFNGGGRGGGGFGGGGFGGGFGGLGAMLGGPGGGGASATGQTPTTHISAVADDHSNSVIVSAPDNLINVIQEMVAQIDISVQDVSTIEVVQLQHADPIEMADEISALFPDDTSADSTRASFNFGGGRGGFPFFGGGARASASTEQSSRMKLQSHVGAVPDPRTGWLILTASKDLMPNIVKMVKQLDEDASHIVHPHVVQIKNANVYEVLSAMNDVIPRNTSTTSSSAANASTLNVLANRTTTTLNQWNSTSANGQSVFSSQGTGH